MSPAIACARSTTCRPSQAASASGARSPGSLQPPAPRQPHAQDLALRLCAAGLSALLCAAVPPPLPAAASVPLTSANEEARRAWAMSQLGGRYSAPSAAPPAEPEEPTSVRIQRLQQLMAAGQEAEGRGDYEAALRSYSAIVERYGDFATAEYSRLARARVLYQLGRTSDAILQLEDLEVSLRGYAEVHAALAAVLYVERPALLQVAEQQWEIAMEFNKQFADPEWVAATKHWPPRLMAALNRFLSLQ